MVSDTQVWDEWASEDSLEELINFNLKCNKITIDDITVKVMSNGVEMVSNQGVPLHGKFIEGVKFTFNHNEYVDIKGNNLPCYIILYECEEDNYLLY